MNTKLNDNSNAPEKVMIFRVVIENGKFIANPYEIEIWGEKSVKGIFDDYADAVAKAKQLEKETGTRWTVHKEKSKRYPGYALRA